MVGYNAGKLRRAAELTISDWQYLAIAMIELFIARIRHATRPASEILQQLRVEDTNSSSTLAATEVDVARLSWAIAAAAARVPWRSDCLLQVMAADRWLRRHGQQPEFFLGTRKDMTGRFEAHAWLRCMDTIVAGGSGTDFATLLEPTRRSLV